MTPMLRLLSDDIVIDTNNLPRPREGADVDREASEISASLFMAGHMFLTVDDWGHVILWQPRYNVGKPTEQQRLLASIAFGVPPEDVNDLDLFLLGGATPLSLVRLTNTPD